MVNENYSNFTRPRPNKGIFQPNEPENHRKEREERKGARAREKKTTRSLNFIVWNLVFERQKKKTRPRKFTDASLGQPGFKKSRYSIYSGISIFQTLDFSNLSIIRSKTRLPLF